MTEDHVASKNKPRVRRIVARIGLLDEVYAPDYDGFNRFQVGVHHSVFFAESQTNEGTHFKGCVYLFRGDNACLLLGCRGSGSHSDEGRDSRSF